MTSRVGPPRIKFGSRVSRGALDKPTAGFLRRNVPAKKLQTKRKNIDQKKKKTNLNQKAQQRATFARQGRLKKNKTNKLGNEQARLMFYSGAVWEAFREAEGGEKK